MFGAVWLDYLCPDAISTTKQFVAFNLSKLFTLKQVIVNPNWYSEQAIEADTLNSRISV